MPPAPRPQRLLAATALHPGDRAEQQDQVLVLHHPREAGLLLAVLADGMGGRRGGRQAAEQLMLTARQVLEAHESGRSPPATLLEALVEQGQATLRLLAATRDDEPHSTLAAVLLTPRREVHAIHVGDSRVHHFRGPRLRWRSRDDAWVQDLVDAGLLRPEDAVGHPKAHLLTACLGASAEPPRRPQALGRLEPGDSLLLCSDGLWPLVPVAELGGWLDTLPPREALDRMVEAARARAQGRGDNLAAAVLKLVEA